MQLPSKVWVVIPAAGTGSRMKSDVPKQYLPLAGQPVLSYSLKLFQSLPYVKGIKLVLAENDEQGRAIAKAFSKVDVVNGGGQRWQSVLNGLNSIESDQDSIRVMVHDAARPCLTEADVESLINTNEASAAILVAPVVDTIKQSTNTVVEKTLNRDHLFRALTPQIAPLPLLIKALTQCVEKKISPTDESQALEFYGAKVQLIKGSANNIKITYPFDLNIAEFIIRQQQGKAS